MYDYVVHEVDKLEYFQSTTLLQILRKHFGDTATQRILVEENYPLLERDAPALCADRMDYGVRDSVTFGLLSRSDAKRIVDDFTVVEGRFAHRSVAIAKTFALAYLVRVLRPSMFTQH